jgi:hypothetical protein
MHGVAHSHIAAIEGIKVTTLEAHYAAELRRGRAEGIAEVQQRVFLDARGNGPNALAARRMYLRFVAGWSESKPVPDLDWYEGCDGETGVRGELLRAASVGSTLQQSATLAGITAGELHDMLEQDLEFAKLYHSAGAKARARMEQIVRQQAEGGDSQAAKFWLERRHPDFHASTNAPTVDRGPIDVDEAGEIPFEYL